MNLKQNFNRCGNECDKKYVHSTDIQVITANDKQNKTIRLFLCWSVTFSLSFTFSLPALRVFVFLLLFHSFGFGSFGIFAVGSLFVGFCLLDLVQVAVTHSAYFCCYFFVVYHECVVALAHTNFFIIVIRCACSLKHEKASLAINGWSNGSKNCLNITFFVIACFSTWIYYVTISFWDSFSSVHMVNKNGFEAEATDKKMRCLWQMSKAITNRRSMCTRSNVKFKTFSNKLSNYHRCVYNFLYTETLHTRC